MPDEKPHFTVREDLFLDAAGRRIKGFTLISGALPADFPMFIGLCVIHLQGPQGTAQQELSFPLKAVSVDEAFLMLEGEAKIAVAKFNEQMKAQALRQNLAAGMPPIPLKSVGRDRFNFRGK